MKKIIILLLFLSSLTYGQELRKNFSLDFTKDYTWTGVNTFSKIIADTVVINDIVNANSTYWINGTDTLAYIDAARSAIGFMRKLTVGTNFVSTDTAFIQFAKIEHLLGGSPIDVQDSLLALDTNITIGSTAYPFGNVHTQELTLNNGSPTSTALSFAGATNSGIMRNTSSVTSIDIVNAGTVQGSFSTYGFFTPCLALGSSRSNLTSFLTSALSAYNLDFYGATNAQNFRVYDKYVNSTTQYRRLTFGWGADSSAQLLSQNAGQYSARNNLITNFNLYSSVTNTNDLGNPLSYWDSLFVQNGVFSRGLSADSANILSFITTPIINVSSLIQLTPLADAPAGVEGGLYADTDHKLYYYNGTAWKEITFVP